MSLKVNGWVVAIITSVAVVLSLPSETFAEMQEYETEIPENEVTIIPINSEISIQKTVTTMTVPEDNQLPWGFVNGKASDYVVRYPVIIQFFKGGEPVHIAQVDVKGDGSYEYKFRVRNVDTNTEEVVNIFEGQYTVKIFKVIPNKSIMI